MTHYPAVSRTASCWQRGSMTLFAFALPVQLGTSAVYAHNAPLDRPVRWSDWNLDPVVILVLTGLAVTYCRGLIRILRRSPSRRDMVFKQGILFAAGVLVIAVALVTPLDPLSEQLSSAHMAQHMLLMTVAAPLMVAGKPGLTMLWGLPPDLRRDLVQRCLGASWCRKTLLILRLPLVAWTVYALATWSWHMPAAFDAALDNPFVHDIQHVSFFFAGCVFWRVLLDPSSPSRLSAPLAVVYLFTTTLHATILGVFMTLAPSPWYAGYVGPTAMWGLTAIEDQQLAGLIMWMPACFPYLAVAVVLFAKSLMESETDQQERADILRANRLAIDRNKRTRPLTTTVPGMFSE